MTFVNRPPILSMLLLATALGTAACDNAYGPVVWYATPDTSVIYSLSRPALLGEPSAYDFEYLRRVVIELPIETGQWDLVLAEEGGGFVFIPSSAFEGLSTRSGLGIVQGTTMDELTKAPGDSAFYQRTAVPVEVGAVYAVRTRSMACNPYGSGVTFGKLEVLSVDVAAGAVKLAAVHNPYCNDRNLVPES
jgi:hypothetical protein